MSGKKIFISAIVLVIAAAVAAGLFLSGSPERERMRRFDQERLNDLSQISYAIDSYRNQEKKLPATLEELKTKRDLYVRSLKDPRTAKPYEYSATATSTYQLCASFETDSDAELARTLAQRPDIEGQDFWKHPIGRKCYELEVRINPELMKTPGVVIPPPPRYPD